MRHTFKYSIIILSVLILTGKRSFADSEKDNKILIIGVDGIINTAIDYASTPAIDKLIDNATYNMNGYGGLPAYSTTGWATLLTGVSASKHGANTNNSFSGNNFSVYPSIVNRIKSANSALKIASVVRNAEINSQLNYEADYKFSFSSDEDALAKSVELLKQADIDVEFVQFSSPEESGVSVGFQLRKAHYVLAIQKVDDYISQLQSAIQSRESYKNENWAIFLVSTHGGTESGIYTNNSEAEINVPIIFSGDDLDNKELNVKSMDPIADADNILTLNKAASGEPTYVRVPIAGTALQGMDKYTIEMWIKAGSDNDSDPSIIGDKDWDSGGNPGFTICRSGTKWKINLANTKSERYDIGSNTEIEDESWHHLAVTFDKTNECIVYQDGEEKSSSKLTYKATDDMTSPFNYLCLAQDGTEKYSGGEPNWSGSFNEVRIWTEALSQETIRKYMYLRDVEESDHPALSSLNLYLKMDEVKGNVVKDYSGKGYNGELVGKASERHPFYPINLTDVSVNILSHLGLSIDSSWGLDGNALKSNVPYRLFKVN